MLNRTSRVKNERTGYSLRYENPELTKLEVKKHNKFRKSFSWTKITATIITSLIMLSGGVATASAATSSVQTANANIFTDMFCMQAQQEDEMGGLNPGGFNTEEGKVKGEITSGANRYAMLLGKTSGFSDITGSTTLDDTAIGGKNSQKLGTKAGQFWGDNASLTAYEKYGVNLPSFTSWTPIYYDKSGGDKGVTFYGFNMQNQTAAENNHFISNQLRDPKTLTSGDKAGTPIANGKLVASDLGTCMNFMGNITAGMTQTFSILPRVVLDWSLALYGLVTGGTDLSDSNSPLYSLGQALDTLIAGGNGYDGLTKIIFTPFLVPLIILGAGWVLWNGIIKKQFSMAAGNVIWMIVAIALGVAFLAKPTAVTSLVEKVVTGVTDGVQDGIIQSASSFASKNNNDITAMCPADIGKGPTNLTEAGYPSVAASARKGQCYAWYSAIYMPWVNGQYGVQIGDSTSSVLTQDPRGILNTDQSRIWYGNSRGSNAVNWPQFQVDRQSTTKILQISEVAYAQLAGENGSIVNTTWQSTGGVGAGINMSFIALALSVTFLVYGFTLLGLILLELLILLLSPFIFLVGIIPQWGMRKVLRIGEILVSTMLKRIVLTILLAFFISMFIIAQGMDQSGFIKILIMIAIAGFFIFAKSRMTGFFTDDISFGGDKRNDLGEGSISRSGMLAAGAANSGGKALASAVTRQSTAGRVKKEDKVRQKQAEKAALKKDALLNGTSVREAKKKKNLADKDQRKAGKEKAKATRAENRQAKIDKAESEKEEKTLRKASRIEHKRNTTLGERNSERAKAVGSVAAKPFVASAKALGKFQQNNRNYVAGRNAGTLPWKVKNFATKGHRAKQLLADTAPTSSNTASEAFDSRFGSDHGGSSQGELTSKAPSTSAPVVERSTPTRSPFGGGKNTSNNEKRKDIKDKKGKSPFKRG